MNIKNSVHRRRTSCRADQAACNYLSRSSRGRAFTLIELCVSIGIISLLISLSVPMLRAVRQEAKKTVCINNIRALGQFHALYAADFKDSFATWLEDPRVYAADRARWLRYAVQSMEVMCRQPWYDYTGLWQCSKTLHCPSAQYGWTPETNDDGSSYQMSVALYTAASYLDPRIPSEALGGVFGGKTQTLTSLAFPSSKVTQFEWHVWHDWPGVSQSGAEMGSLQWNNRERRASLAFGDGHVRQLSCSGVPWVWRIEHWISGPYQSTPMGVAGMDFGSTLKPPQPPSRH